jgi:hypothetical protein
VGSHPGCRGWKPAANRLSYGTTWFDDKCDTNDDNGTATATSNDVDEPRDAGQPPAHPFRIPELQNSHSGLEIGHSHSFFICAHISPL